MKKFLFLALFLSTTVLFSSCASVKSPLMGVIYTDVKAPEAVTSNVGKSKVGTAVATSILGLVAQGDASIDAAARSAGITRIHHVDYHSTSILGIYSTFTVTVYGE
ncbi:MAG: TRL-like family protein [Endomicrobiia bacterium]|nr:TRL-like family protein [Endomicrobiaceae bacterium]MDD3053525.1 TRL-like family protein [Endomicrobiaceae bacterium]MDD3922487.1 TRL-like family protein [Endomicrobiaceae bacterium]MDD5102449.1 TRL-like family protein [Endomicrobiaceae bacterium]